MGRRTHACIHALSPGMVHVEGTPDSGIYQPDCSWIGPRAAYMSDWRRQHTQRECNKPPFADTTGVVRLTGKVIS